jgi:hypothetical protein
MRQTFDETTDRSFGPKHVPLIRQAMAQQGLDGLRTNTCPPQTTVSAGRPASPARRGPP